MEGKAGMSQLKMENTTIIEYVDCKEDTQLIETFFDASSEDVVQLIEKTVEDYIKQLKSVEEPSLSVITRSATNAVFCKKEQYIRMKLGTTHRKLSDGKRFQGLWKVLQICYSLCKNKKSVNQRELYYMNTDIFASQRECDYCIQDCIALLRVPRDALGITATSKGYVTGRLLLSAKNSGNWTDLSVDKPVSITYQMITTLQMRSDAKCIIVIEKDGIFKRLYEDRFFDDIPCILITGRGFPDIATRAFTHHLATTLNLPVYGICDWNPYGMALLMTYILGSLASGLETYRYCMNLHWIGLFYQDIISLALPESVRQPFSKMDRSKCHSLQSHPFIQSNEIFRRELENMKKYSFKAELESVYCHGIEYFSKTYLKQKVLSIIG